MASSIAKFLNAPAQAGLMAARPVPGDIGILMPPEVQEWDYMLSHEGGFDTYQAALWGVYRGFFDLNVQADWVNPADIDGYKVLYFPYPIMFPEALGKRLADWVAAGGTLISEACPGYFGDRGKVGQVQPNHGLDAVFGVREDEVEFMPDIGDRIRLSVFGAEVQGGGFLQSYHLAGGTELGRFADGRRAVVEHRHGKGRTLLVGTHPSVGYSRTQKAAAYFRGVLDWAGVVPRVAVTTPTVLARLPRGAEGDYLWVVNSSKTPQSGQVTLAGAAAGTPQILWPAQGAGFDGTAFTVPAQEALIVRL
jgi:beta-galactosidase